VEEYACTKLLPCDGMSRHEREGPRDGKVPGPFFFENEGRSFCNALRNSLVRRIESVSGIETVNR
jgi:hypothetical protein